MMRDTAVPGRTNHVFGGATIPMIAILVVGVSVAVAHGGDSYIDRMQAAAGRVWYDKYCTPCHGSGGGPGSAMYRGTDRQVDLTRYVARHNGQFPAHEWMAVVEQVDLQLPHHAVWEDIRGAQVGTSAQAAAGRGVVALIAEYILSVQTKD
jgi:hypothetical protein